MNQRMQLGKAPISGGFKMDEWWVWCGSVIKGDDDKYHMFASRWSKSLPMHPGWLTSSEIVRATADQPKGPYAFQEVVLPARGAQYWDGRSTHNPHICRYKDTYLLYYMGSTHPFDEIKDDDDLGLEDKRVIVGRANKRIGLATSKSVFGPWKRLDKPILDVRPDHFDNYLVSNPAPCINEDGSVLLMYKARSFVGNDFTRYMMFGVAYADHFNGPYVQQLDEPLFSNQMLDGHKINIEDPFIWKTGSGYHLIAKDMQGHICGEKHGGICAQSQDGIHWDLHIGEKSYSREVTWDDGTNQTMGCLERPFMLFDEAKPTHMFFATANGAGGFNHATETWNMVIPFV